jgi:uncharacterized protein
MILDLRAFEEFPAKAVIQADSGELSPFADSVICVESVRVELAVQNSADEYFCQGQVVVRVALECARCLVRFEQELSGTIDFIACSEEDATKHRGGDSEEYVPFTGNDLSVDLVEPVRQALTLVLPMMPVCTEDCRGLCSSCGANLNEKNCDCKNETTDSRWDGLKGLDQK